MRKTYIYKYTTKDGVLLGYHYDSFCTMGMDIKEAKRYPMEESSISAQTETIRTNFDYLCDHYGNGERKGFKKEDILLEIEELSEGFCYENNLTQTLVLVPLN